METVAKSSNTTTSVIHTSVIVWLYTSVTFCLLPTHQHDILWKDKFYYISKHTLYNNDFYSKKFKDVASECSPKLTWILIRDLTNTKHIDKNKINLITVNNENLIPHNDSIKVSNLFNKFFFTIGGKLASKILY